MSNPVPASPSPTRGERLDALRSLGTPRSRCSDFFDSLDAEGRARVDHVALSLRPITARIRELELRKAASK